MSGVAGLVSYTDSLVNASNTKANVAAMMAAMPHRCADRLDIWQQDEVAFGFGELAASIGLPKTGFPFVSQSQQVVVMLNGNVHNLSEIQSELGRVTIHQDLPLLPQLLALGYRKWGESLANKLVGEFVLFVWDIAARELYAARDAVGTRFFYYRTENGCLEFASEIKAFFAIPHSRRRINQSRLLDFLAIEFDRDEQVQTMYEGVFRLPQGHYLKYAKAGLRIQRYWHPENLSERTFNNHKDCAEEFSWMLQLAIKDRLRGEQPVASALSGGLDSSTIAALTQRKLNHPLHTFTLTQRNKNQCADWQCVKRMLEQDDFQATVIAADEPIAFYTDLMEKVRHFDEPFSWTHSLCDILTYSSAKAAGCGVMIDGTAGDMLFYSTEKTLNLAAASGKFSIMREAINAAKFNEIEQGEINLLLRSIRRRWIPERWRTAIRPLFRAQLYKDYIDADYSGNFLAYLKPRIAEEYVQNKLEQRNERRKDWVGESELVKHAYRYLSGEIAFAQENKETASAFCQIESASPFADRRLVEFALQMPESAKMAIPSYKWLLREVGKELLPREISQRRDMAAHPGWDFTDYFITLWNHHYANWSPSPEFATIDALLSEFGSRQLGLSSTTKTTADSLKRAESVSKVDSANYVSTRAAQQRAKVSPEHKFERFTLEALNQWLLTP